MVLSLGQWLQFKKNCINQTAFMHMGTIKKMSGIMCHSSGSGRVRSLTMVTVVQLKFYQTALVGNTGSQSDVLGSTRVTMPQSMVVYGFLRALNSIKWGNQSLILKGC